MCAVDRKPPSRREGLKFVVVVDRQRCMIGELLVLVDALLLRRLRDAGRGDLIIDAPAYVLGIGLTAVRPPGVLIGFVVEGAEYIHPAEILENLGEPGTLLRQEAGVFLVAAPVLEIDFLVRDVPVAAQDVLAPVTSQFLQYWQEMRHEAVLGFLPMRAGGTGWQGQGRDAELAEVGLQGGAPLVMFF